MWGIADFAINPCFSSFHALQSLQCIVFQHLWCCSANHGRHTCGMLVLEENLGEFPQSVCRTSHGEFRSSSSMDLVVGFMRCNDNGRVRVWNVEKKKTTK